MTQPLFGPSSQSPITQQAIAQALASNNRPVSSPLAGVAQMGSKWAEALLAKKLQAKDKSEQAQAQRVMAQALQEYKGAPAGFDPSTGITWNSPRPPNEAGALAQMLSNEHTAPYAMQLQLGDIEADRAMALEDKKYQRERADKLADWEKDAALKRELAALRAGSGGWEQDETTGEMVFVPATETVSDPTSLANALGVPAEALDTRNMSPKDASTYAKNTRLNAEKRLQGEDMTGAASQARSNKRDAERFEQLMSQQNTGPIAGSRLNPISYFDSEISEMRKIQDRLTPQQRAPGSGSTSNFDAQMFQNALFGANAPEETNKSVIAFTKAQASDELNKQAFMSDYLTANGHLNGADKSWQEYLDNNPIFDPESPTKPVLNSKRKTYQEYFGVGGQAKAPATKTIDGVTYENIDGQWYAK